MWSSEGRPGVGIEGSLPFVFWPGSFNINMHLIMHKLFRVYPNINHASIHRVFHLASPLVPCRKDTVPVAGLALKKMSASISFTLETYPETTILWENPYSEKACRQATSEKHQAPEWNKTSLTFQDSPATSYAQLSEGPQSTSHRHKDHPSPAQIPNPQTCEK